MENTPQTTPLLVLFHAQCPDGFCAAWVARRKWPNAEFQAVKHGEPPPDVTGRDVLIVDFAYPRNTLLEMKEKAASILVFDHHISAQRDLEGLDFCVFDMERSGAGLTWDLLFPNTDRPFLVNYVEDRDIWKWKLSDSKAVCAALSCYKKDFETWDNLLAAGLPPLIAQGKAVLTYEDRIIDIGKALSREVQIAGHRVMASNIPYLQSEVGEALAQERPFSVCWHTKADGRVQFSLRSRDPWGIDVSEVAKSFGGGGHKQAAGFILPYADAMELLFHVPKDTPEMPLQDPLPVEAVLPENGKAVHLI